jgi:hypothetical protein
VRSYFRIKSPPTGSYLPVSLCATSISLTRDRTWVLVVRNRRLTARSTGSLKTKIKHNFILGFSLYVTENSVFALKTVINKCPTGNQWQLITDILFIFNVICLSFHFHVGNTVICLHLHLHRRKVLSFSFFCFCTFISAQAVCVAWCSRLCQCLAAVSSGL